MKSFDLFGDEAPFSTKSPEQLMEERQEKAPRQYAKEIFQDCAKGMRLLEVDRRVPKHLRELVREHIRAAELREAKILKEPIKRKSKGSL